MACKACGSSTGAEVCLHCGHEFCPKHRDEAGGVAACFDCIKAEGERKRQVRKPSARQASAAVAAGSAEPVQVQVVPPAPLPEPRGNFKPFVLGMLAAAPSAGYVHWVLGKLTAENEWPAAMQHVGAGAFGLFVLAGVFAIAKSK